MIRKLRWPLLALFLMVVGAWPAAAAPIALIAAGLGVVIAMIPGPALLAIAGVAWLKHRPAPARTA